MSWCLPRFLAKPLLKKLKSGEISPDSIREMLPNERHKYFADMLGEEHGTKVNALLESKLILKDWQRGMVTWVKEISGLKPNVQKDIIAKVTEMKKLLTPAQEKEFMQDLVNHKLGTEVPLQAAQKLTKLASTANEFKSKVKEDFTFNTEAERLAYGKAAIDFRNYYAGLQNAAEKMTVLEHVQHPILTLDKMAHNILGLTKSTLTTLDNSVVGTQGLKTLLNDAANTILFKPTHQWLNNAIKTLPDMVKTWGGKAVADMTNAEIVSRPNALNGLYKKHRVAIDVMEENYPEHLGGIPVVGRALKGFENAFAGFQKRNRADTFDALVKMAKAAGKDPFSPDIDGFGKLANTLTARGTLELGRYDFEVIGDFVNLVAFAGRFAKSSVDFLTFNQIHQNMSPYARKVGAIQSLKGIAVIAGFLALTDAIRPGSVIWDTTRSDFGGIRLGSIVVEPFKQFTTFVVLASRLITGQYTNKEGKVTELNTGKYGQPTRKDVLYDFMEGRSSPPARIALDILEGRDFKGKKPTVKSEAAGVLTPLPAQTGIEYYENPYVEDADKILAMIFENIGVRTSPEKYPPREKKKHKTAKSKRRSNYYKK
jgi:hypothetical protein